jgi:hypothetical protein
MCLLCLPWETTMKHEIIRNKRNETSQSYLKHAPRKDTTIAFTTQASPRKDKERELKGLKEKTKPSPKHKRRWNFETFPLQCTKRTPHLPNCKLDTNKTCTVPHHCTVCPSRRFSPTLHLLTVQHSRSSLCPLPHRFSPSNLPTAPPTARVQCIGL